MSHIGILQGEPIGDSQKTQIYGRITLSTTHTLYAPTGMLK